MMQSPHSFSSILTRQCAPGPCGSSAIPKSFLPNCSKPIVAMARAETNSAVRNQLACSAKRWPAREAMTVVRELLTHAEDVNDPQIPLLLWWAIEDKAVSHQVEVLSLLSNAADWNQLLMRSHILERLARRFASDTSQEARQACERLLTTAPTRENRDAVLRGFDKAWEGQRNAGSTEIRQALTYVWSANDPLLLRVGLRAGLAGGERASARAFS